MFAVVNHLHLTKSVDELGVAVEKEGASILGSLPGFKGSHFVKVDDTHCIVIILWNTPVDAQNGAQQFGPSWFNQNITPYLTSVMDNNFKRKQPHPSVPSPSTERGS